MVIGVGLLIYFTSRDPQRITQTGRVFLDDAEAEVRGEPMLRR